MENLNNTEIDTKEPKDEFDDLYFDDPYGTLTDQDIEVMLFSWYGPSHIKHKVGWRYYLNLGLLVTVIILILIFLQQIYLLMVILALMFLLVIMTLVPPKPIKHIITNYGVYSGTTFYNWEDKGKNFWIEKDEGQRILIIQIKKFPYQSIMLLGEKTNQDQIIEILSNFMKYKNPQKKGADKIITWWKKTFPLDW